MFIFAISKTVETSVGMGGAVVFVLGITVPFNYLLENYVLQEGALASWLGDDFKMLIYLFYLLLCL